NTPSELESSVEQPATSSSTGAANQTVDKLFSGMPPASSHPLIISFGPKFFEWVSAALPAMQNFTDKSVTIFIKRPVKIRKSAILRIETESTSGTTMLALLNNYFSQISITRQQAETPDRCEFGFGRHKIYAQADRNAVYLSVAALNASDSQAILNQIIPFNTESFVEIIFDWKNFQALLPKLIQPFVSNPFAPFIKIYSRYTIKDGNLNEFSTVTTGKAENDDFMKKFARSLFAFKLQTQNLGIETTIRVRGDGEIIYISTDFEKIAAWLQKRFKLNHPLLQKLLDHFLARTKCFLNRMFYAPELEKSCPAGGKIKVDAISGLVQCNLHSSVPAIPMILDEHACCSYNRERLFRYLQSTDSLNASDTISPETLESIARKLGIPMCPTSGTFTIDENSIKCSEHEN
ncbi:MAG: hypothetical protein PHD82_16770, partial [Candidatus Riflebacteria bacterium]|nr:hypothetical protein [Candidatus Riflebacteria bacterium]